MVNTLIKEINASIKGTYTIINISKLITKNISSCNISTSFCLSSCKFLASSFIKSISMASSYSCYFNNFINVSINTSYILINMSCK